MKRTALFLAGILAISSLSGCGAKNSDQTAVNHLKESM